MNFRLNHCLPLSLVCLAAVASGAGPVRAQGADPAAQSVTIINTGYGLLPGYRIAVGPKGELSSTMQPRYRAKPIMRTDRMTSLNRQEFFRDLAKAGKLNTLPTGGRRGRRNTTPSITANVPGPQVFVVYRGQQTPNLRAAGNSAGKALYQDVKKIMSVLRLPVPDYP